MLFVLPHVYVERYTAHPLSRSELGLPEPRAAGFCRNPVEILPKWAKKWSCASSCTRETFFRGLIPTPARSAVMFECGDHNRRCRLDRPHHRGEKVPYHEPSRQTGEVRRAHASACATTRRAVLGSEPRACAYRAGRSAPIRRLGEAPWSAPIVIVAHPLLPGEKKLSTP